VPSPWLQGLAGSVDHAVRRMALSLRELTLRRLGSEIVLQILRLPPYLAFGAVASRARGSGPAGMWVDKSWSDTSLEGRTCRFRIERALAWTESDGCFARACKWAWADRGFECRDSVQFCAYVRTM
jgi:hypothetical protein